MIADGPTSTSQERRLAHRLRVNIKTHWESKSKRRDGVILDLSQKGCFIVTPDEIPVGATITVEVGLPKMLHMTLEGIAIRHSKGRGVGVRFKDLTPTQQMLLMKLIRSIVQQRLK